MTIRRFTVGTGITAREQVSVSGDDIQAAQELLCRVGLEAERNDQGFEGLAESLSEEAEAILITAGLPAVEGIYEYCVETGEWRTFDGQRTLPPNWGAADLTRLVDGLGHEPDSEVGYAARFIAKIDRVRREKIRGDVNRALLEAAKLGRLLQESVMKSEHERDALAGSSSREGASRGGLARVTETRIRDKLMAEEFQRRWDAGTKLSRTELKARIGASWKGPGERLSRSASIDAINRGLKILSS